MKTYNAAILLVDDDRHFLEFVESGLRHAGATGPIRGVSSGDEAIAYLGGEGRYDDRAAYPYPNFIITDLKMSNGDGFNLLRYLKSHADTAIIPTVVFSGSSDLDDIKSAYRLGASSYHVKPHTPQALRQQLKILHDYWMSCETPQIDAGGRQILTDSEGKLGQHHA